MFSGTLLFQPCVPSAWPLMGLSRREGGEHWLSGPYIHCEKHSAFFIHIQLITGASIINSPIDVHIEVGTPSSAVNCQELAS
jgi:hypothetical protein